jgi:hypothetical protein
MAFDTRSPAFRDTVLTYRRVYRVERRDLPAHMAAIEALRVHQPDNPRLSHTVATMISYCTQMDPKWFWQGTSDGPK